MLFMVVQHFFVDGAQHICEAWNFCPVPEDSIIPEPHPSVQIRAGAGV